MQQCMPRTQLSFQVPPKSAVTHRTRLWAMTGEEERTVSLAAPIGAPFGPWPKLGLTSMRSRHPVPSFEGAGAPS